MPSPAYLPDPNKWISTSSSKPKPPQRPLVAFRHGFPTPPTSVARNVRTDGNAASSGQVRQKQATLSGLGLGEPSKRAGSSGVGERGLGMLSPPSTTRERGTRRLGHILDSGGRGSPAPRRKESKLRVRADDYWNSDEDGDGEGLEDEPGPSRTGTAGSSKPVSYLSSRTRPGKVEKKRSPKSTSTSKGKDREDKSAAVLSAFSSGELSDLPPEYMSDYERPSPASRPAARDRADNPNVVLTAAPAPIHPNPRTLAATRAIPSSLTPSTQPRPLAPRHASPRPFSAAPTPASTRAEPTPPEHSPRPLTPVPKNVLAIHRQLCGQDPAQLERVHSPWRRQTSAQRLAREEAWREEDRKMRDERKRDREKTLAAKQDRKAQVDERVRNRSMLLRGSDGVKRTRSLVDWGESEGSSPKRMRAGVPLTQLRPNSLVLTRSPPSKERAERSRALHLDMITSGSGGKQTAPKPSILARSFGENPSAERALDLASKSRPNPLLVDPTVNQGDARPSHAGTPRIPPVSSATVADEPASPASPSPAPPSDPPHPSSTPKKSPATGHHTVTPPKTTGMRGQAHQETLFAFPPPPQPNFNADPAPPRRAKQDFRPVEMQAETLLTWSLGPGVAGPNSIDEKEVRHDAGQAGPEQAEGIAGANEPQRRNPVDVTPDKDAMELREKTQEIPRRYSDSDQSESASFAPSVYSESFPRLLSSPTATRTTSTARHSPVKAADHISAGAGTVKAFWTTPKPIPSAPTGWAALHQGILSAPISAPLPSPSASTPTASTTKRPRRTPQGAGFEVTPTQTKLAAFGFFNQQKRRMRNDFDKEWEEEDDLELGMDVDDDEEGPMQVPVDSEDVVGEERPMAGARLGRVPEAPHHPSLRPAGVRELHRMERRERSKDENRQHGGVPAYNDGSIVRPRPVPVQGPPQSRTANQPSESHGSDEQDGQDAPLFHPPSTSSRSSGSGTGLSSSLTTSDADVPRVSEETKRWWDRLGRSSSGVEQERGGYDE